MSEIVQPPGWGLECTRCHGSGEIVVDWDAYLNGGADVQDTAVADCPDCDGIGNFPSPPTDGEG